MPISREDCATVSDFATQVSERITELRNPVSEGVRTHCFLKDLDNESLVEIENLLCSVVTAAYPKVKDSTFISFLLRCSLTVGDNAQTTRPSAVVLTERLSKIDSWAIEWERGDQGENDSDIELFLDWALSLAKYQVRDENFMEAPLVLPPFTDELPVVTLGDQTVFNHGSGYRPPVVDTPYTFQRKPSLYEFTRETKESVAEVKTATSDVPA